MSDESSSIATEPKAVVEIKSMSDSDYLAKRTASLAGKKPEEAKATEVPNADAKAEAEPAVAAEGEEAKGDDQKSVPEADAPKAKTEDVLSKVDLTQLSDEQLMAILDRVPAEKVKEFGKKNHSGIIERYGELTAKRKIAEEEASKLRAERQQAPQLEGKPADIPDNIAKVSSVEELNELYQKSNDYIEWAEDALFTNDHLGADDVIAEHEGKPYTKKDVKTLLGLARKNRDKFLPARLRQLQEAEQRRAQKDAYQVQARKEIPWLEGEDNDLRRQFEATIKSPVLEKVRRAVPEAEPILDYMVAHAVNSAYGRREIKDPAFQQPAAKINPPAISPGSSAPAERPDAKTDKASKDIQSRFRTTGSEKDFVALRTAQMTKRKPIA